MKTWYNDATTNFRMNRPEPKPPTLKSELGKLDPKRATLIKQLYYQVADALPQLAEELEFADLDIIHQQGDPDDYHETREAAPLLDEHMTVCAMLDVFKRLDIGKYL